MEGIDRFERRKAGYLRNVQRFQNHTGCSSLNYVPFKSITNKK